MADQEHLNILKQGVVVWNNWRQEHQDIKPDFSDIDLSRADLEGAHLEKAYFTNACLEGVNLSKSHLEGTNFSRADLRGANLSEANLSGANLSEAHLEGTDLCKAYLSGEKKLSSKLLPADLRGVFFDNTTNLEGAILGNEKYGSVSLADAHWGSVNLSAIDWTKVNMLGDEWKAYQYKQLNIYRIAARTNRQLAVELEEQGLNAQASPFAYRARKLERQILSLQVFLQLRHRQEHRWLLHLLRPARRQFHLRFLAVSLPMVLCLLLWFFTFSIPQLNSFIPLIIFEFGILPFLLIISFRRSITKLLLLIISIFLVLIMGIALLETLLLKILLLFIAHFSPEFYLTPQPLLFINILALIPPLILILLAYFILRLHFSWLKRFQVHIGNFINYLKPLSLLLGNILKSYGLFTFSLFLDQIAGYGYKPARSFLWYGIVIVSFAIIYYTIGVLQVPLHPIFSPLGALVFSMTSFHGRGFFPSENLMLDNPITVVAAIEAFVGLIIEVSFIATFTQRFLGK